jgi:hypothetical protein
MAPPESYQTDDADRNTLVFDEAILSLGFVQLPRLVLFAANLSAGAKVLYSFLLNYAWQKERCFPGYTRLAADLQSSENSTRKYMRELEAAGLITHKRRGLGLTNIYTLHSRPAHIAVQEHHKAEVAERTRRADQDPAHSAAKTESEGKRIRRKENGAPRATSTPRPRQRDPERYTHGTYAICAACGIDPCECAG